MNNMPMGAYSSQQAMNKRPKGYSEYALQQYDPQQMALYNQDFGLVGKDSDLRRMAMGDQSMFGEIEAPALRQFNELTGNIASKFSGAGMGGRLSSGFQNTMTQAGQDFASQLQTQRQDLRRQAIMDLMGISESLLGRRPTERGYAQKPEKQSSGWGGAIGSALGSLAGFLSPEPGGMLKGAKLGYGIGSSF